MSNINKCSYKIENHPSYGNYCQLKTTMVIDDCNKYCREYYPNKQRLADII